MLRYKYKFTLHQVYAHYANHGNLHWRDLATSTKVSTRTLLKYFESTEKLSRILADYHIKYLNNYYSKFVIDPTKYESFPFKLLFNIIVLHKICYLFTDKASQYDLANRGDEIMNIHLDHIREAMIRGGVNNQEKLNTVHVFENFCKPLRNGISNEKYMEHLMNWYWDKH